MDRIDRVAVNTPDHINARIRAETIDRLAYFAQHPEEIEERLDELDEEWDIERTLELNASTLAFTGAVLAAATDKRFILVPAVVTGFLFQHAVQGWCPPLGIFRRRGYRTEKEIAVERYALKALRGDFEEIPTSRRHGGAAYKAASI